MALSPQFLDELRARTPMHGLVSRSVRLSKSGRNWKGCCPFHSEKSPSFYVYEDGYHCFGCGAHGDAITYVMQTGGGSFIDAVESLAAEAGLEVPKPSARAVEIEQERLDLFGVLEAAQAEFVRLLHAKEGAAWAGVSAGAGVVGGDDRAVRAGVERGRAGVVDECPRAGGDRGGDDGGGRAVAGAGGRGGGAGAVLGAGDVPDPGPAGADDQLRGADAGGCEAEVHQWAGDAAVFEKAHAVCAGPGAGGGSAGSVGGGRGVYGRDRAAPGGVRGGGGAAGDGVDSGAVGGAVAAEPGAGAVLRRGCGGVAGGGAGCGAVPAAGECGAVVAVRGAAGGAGPGQPGAERRGWGVPGGAGWGAAAGGYAVRGAERGGRGGAGGAGGAAGAAGRGGGPDFGQDAWRRSIGGRCGTDSMHSGRCCGRHGRRGGGSGAGRSGGRGWRGCRGWRRRWIRRRWSGRGA